MTVSNAVCMNTLGNIFWLLFGGIEIGLLYCLAGLVMCITIIGIPFAVQLFKLGAYCFWPFGRDFADGAERSGCVSTFMNVIWILAGWWEIALCHLFFALLFCITIVGIPLAKIHFRIAKASAFPFGTEIKRIH